MSVSAAAAGRLDTAAGDNQVIFAGKESEPREPCVKALSQVSFA